MSIDNMGRAPLHFAAGAGHLAAAKLLLDARAYFELEDATRRTALHHAARGGHVDVSQLLLDTGSRIDPMDGDHRTPLHHTSRSDMLFNMTLLLLERGANFELEDLIGFRPLHYSCTFGQLLTTMKLMDLGADVWAIDKSGWSPILHASAQEDLDFAAQLVNRISRPREFPKPDPSRFIVLGEGDVGGFPAWILILVVVLLLSIAIVIPGCRIIRRFQRASCRASVVLFGGNGIRWGECCGYCSSHVVTTMVKSRFAARVRPANPMWWRMMMRMPMNLLQMSSVI